MAKPIHEMSTWGHSRQHSRLQDEEWQATRELTQLQTQVMESREDYLSSTSRDIGRRVSDDTHELFVVCEPAEALLQQLQHLQPDLIAVHDIASDSSRRLLAGLVAATRSKVQKLLIRRQGYGLPLATLEFAELPGVNGQTLRVYTTIADADSQQRQRIAAVLLGHAKLGVVIAGDLPPHALETALEPLHEGMVHGPWINRNLLMVPLGGSTALSAAASRLATGSSVVVRVTPQALKPGDAWGFISLAWDRIRQTGTLSAPAQRAYGAADHSLAFQPSTAAAQVKPSAPAVSPARAEPAQVASMPARAAMPTAYPTPSAASTSAPTLAPTSASTSSSASLPRSAASSATTSAPASVDMPAHASSTAAANASSAGSPVSHVAARNATPAVQAAAIGAGPLAPARAAVEASTALPQSGPAATAQAAAPLAMQPMPTIRRPTDAAAAETSPWQLIVAQCAGLPGVVSCVVVDMASQRPLAHAGSKPGPAALSSHGGSLWEAMLDTVRQLGLPSGTMEATLTLAGHHLLLRALPGQGQLGLVAVLDRVASDLPSVQAQITHWLYASRAAFTAPAPASSPALAH